MLDFVVSRLCDPLEQRLVVLLFLFGEVVLALGQMLQQHQLNPETLVGAKVKDLLSHLELLKGLHGEVPNRCVSEITYHTRRTAGRVLARSCEATCQAQ